MSNDEEHNNGTAYYTHHVEAPNHVTHVYFGPIFFKYVGSFSENGEVLEWSFFSI